MVALPHNTEPNTALEQIRAALNHNRTLGVLDRAVVSTNYAMQGVYNAER